MAEIGLSQLGIDFGDMFQMQQALGTPKQMKLEIQPVADFPSCCKCAANSTTATTTITLLPAIPGKSYLILGAVIGMTMDAACDLARLDLYVYQSTTNLNFLQLKFPTGAALSKEIGISLKLPLKTDMNTAVTLSGAKTAGNCTKYATVYYIEV